MEEKMMKAYNMMKAAMAEMESCMGGGEKEDPSEMPEQEDSAEEGDYSGKGMMSKDSPEGMDMKKQIAMSVMKKKGY